MSLLSRRLLRQVLSNVCPPRLNNSRAKRRSRLMVDQLEGRDVPSGTPTVSIAAGSDGSEDGAHAHFTVTLSEPNPGPNTLAFMLGLSGSATYGSSNDFYGFVSCWFQPNAASFDVDFTPVDDSIVEGTETITATVPAGSGYVVGSNGSATVNLLDNDHYPLPYVQDDTLTTHAGTPGSVNVLANDYVMDMAGLTVVGHTNPAHGTVAFSGGVATYTPADPTFTGTDSFGYTVSTAYGDTASASVAVAVTNTPPSAWGASATIYVGGTVSYNALANAYDMDGDTLTLTNVQAAHGTVAVSGGTLVYTPEADWSGTTTVSYTVDDGHGGTTPGQVAVTVLPAATATSLDANGIWPAGSFLPTGLMLTATVRVTGPGTAPLAGTVTFYDGSTALGTVQLSGTGTTATVSLTTSGLSVGGHPITAAFSGGGACLGSTSDQRNIVLSVKDDEPLQWSSHWAYGDVNSGSTLAAGGVGGAGTGAGASMGSPITSDDLTWDDFVHIPACADPEQYPFSAYTYGDYTKSGDTPTVATLAIGSTSGATAISKATFVGPVMFSVVFDSGKSYVHEGEETSYLLSHERLHLRIAEYTATKATANMPPMVGDFTAEAASIVAAATISSENAVELIKLDLMTYLDKWVRIDGKVAVHAAAVRVGISEGGSVPALVA